MGKRVARTRNGGAWTEAQYWGRIRSALRRMSMYWKPIKEARDRAKRPYKGRNKRQKWEFQCAQCKNWFPQKSINVDHIVEAGSLRCAEDLPGFVERLFCEDVNGYQVLCKNQKENGKIIHHGCHEKKSHKK